MPIIEMGADLIVCFLWYGKTPSGPPPLLIIRHEFQDEVARNISGHNYSSQAGSLAAVAISALR